MPCSSCWDAKGWVFPGAWQHLGKLNEALRILEFMLLFFQKVKKCRVTA